MVSEGADLNLVQFQKSVNDSNEDSYGILMK